MITEINGHKVQNGDIMQGIDKLMQNEKADFIYSDPPWGLGNLKYWQTMNYKMNNIERKKVEFEEFIFTFFSIIKKYAKDRVVIEYGIRWREVIENLSKQFGFFYNGHATSFYKSGSKLLPVDIHFLTKTEKIIINKNLIDTCKEKNGLDLVEGIFDLYCKEDTKLVLDPMCGMGYTAQASINRGYKFRGNELNYKRLQKTIKRLSK